MPPRSITLLIVAAWLGMSGWLFFRDLWPGLRPNEPPPYTTMPSDEAASNPATIRWTVLHNGNYVYDAETWIKYHEKGDERTGDDSFELAARFRARQLPGQETPKRRLRSFVNITRGSELRAVNAQLHMLVQDLEILCTIEAVVEEGHLLPRWRVNVWQKDLLSEDRVFDRERDPPASKPLQQFDAPFPPLPFATHGLVLNPLHPPNRLDTVRPGQHWRMPLVNSLVLLEKVHDAVHSAVEKRPLDELTAGLGALLQHAFDGIHFLDAQVLPDPQPLPAGNSKSGPARPPECLVIEARHEKSDTLARLWVDHTGGARQGLILRQEVVFHGTNGDDTWVVNREP
jgi:hypothetical protein